jgi:methylated-DNA-[protein]-cysteine S-methyltransferase
VEFGETKGNPMTALVTQTVETPDGPFTIIERAGGPVVASGWTADAAGLAPHPRGLSEEAVSPGRVGAAAAVEAYYAGDLAAAGGVAVDQQGGAFYQAVWAHLRGIAPGEVQTYGAIAVALGHPGAARAVGTACGRNAASLFVPCHRVVAATGGLGGFGWGVSVKSSLLVRESAA